MGLATPDSGDVLAFTAEQVSKLTGLTERQLRAWDETGFFSPELLGDPRAPHRRIYTFRDVVGLRTIAELRAHGVRHAELRKVGAWLRAEHDKPWSSLRFWVGGKTVYFSDPATGRPISAHPARQAAMLIALTEVVARVRAEAAKLRERRPDQVGVVAARRHILGGAPVLAGTRVPVAAIRELHQAGYSPSEILREFPRLALEDIDVALAYRGEKKAAT